MAQVIRGTISPEMDINVLFEKSTVEEIQQIEKKTRSDIERKKEDLRQMVGERYRDLIEAADKITEMKTSAENVMQSISRMQELCQGLKTMQKMSHKPVVAEKSAKHQENLVLYGIATQIKVLQDMPEKMWSCLDSGQFLQATQLYLLARHIWTNLQTEGYHTSNFMSRFTVLQTQWAAISHFRGTILEKSRETLRESNADQLTAECLSSILLLEDSTPRQVFNEFLLLRKNAVEKVFHSETGQQSIKDQVCEVVKTISNTIHQIYSLFYHPPEGSAPVTTCDLFVKVIKRVTDAGEAGVIIPTQQGSLSAKYLPKSVSAFRPVLKHSAAPIKTSSLKQNCQDWIKTCTQDLQTGLEPLLSFIKTVKGLSAIRDQVWDILYEDDKQTTWNAVCNEIVGSPIALWEDLLRPHFNARVQAILLGHFNEALNTCELQTARVLVDLNNPKEKYTEVEHDVCNYVWMESNTDIAPQSAWVSVNNKTLADSGTLLMKARAYTPAIQSLCKNFDGRLGLLLDDIRYYLKDTKEENKGNANKSDLSLTTENTEESKKPPFDKYADNEIIQAFIKSSCKDCVQKLLGIFNQQLDACKDQLKQEETRNIRYLTDKALLLGRLSYALCELSPHMQQCMMGTVDKADVPKLPRKSSARSKQAEDPEWAQLKVSLQQFSQSAFRVWTDSLVSHLMQTFKGGLLDSSSHGVLLATLRWDEVMIQEETEDGSTVKSSIRVPMQASWSIQTLLYNICADINRVGGHALNRAILQELVHSLSDKILEAYEELLKNQKKGNSKDAQVPIGQARALQLIFDLKLISNILPKKSDEKEAKKYNAKLNKVVESLESLVDPFDLDVFSPYIQSHLTKQTQRCQVLYGALMSLDKHSLFFGTRHLGTSQQEQHNILPMTTSQNRFPLLPLSVQNRPSIVAPIVQAPKPKTPASPTTGGFVPDLSVDSESSMSTSLFGNWFSARR